jgi:hypothetical protein
MSSIFVNAGIIAVIFFIVKFIEMRVIDKESKPLKLLIRDTLFVYFSVIAGNFIIDQISPAMLQEAGELVSNPAVFTDNPGF